ncbi:hypothetical protein [Agrococcus sp. SGAir0287]|uniref:hypothetical protein n=1 Tax=Agrococcus sp. SGAir0287 TaxID=2070347 RepID=UPI0010CD25C5|nr:hypothetical protein [Agrococcus sp. SGAir0287]QCR20273.1 hypothetical protein C1N71_13195 [Agrococcus sp. SGAir0287]
MSERRGLSMRTYAFVLVAVLLLASGVGAFAYAANATLAAAQGALTDAETRLDTALEEHADRVEQEHQQEAAAAAAAAAADQAARELEEEQALAAELGLTPAGTPGLYVQWAPTTDYTCGYWDCAALYIVSLDATCPSMVYVEANIVSGSTVVGFTNATLGSLRPGGTGAVMLENFTGFAGEFDLTEVNCW